MTQFFQRKKSSWHSFCLSIEQKSRNFPNAIAFEINSRPAIPPRDVSPRKIFIFSLFYLPFTGFPCLVAIIIWDYFANSGARANNNNNYRWTNSKKNKNFRLQDGGWKTNAITPLLIVVYDFLEIALLVIVFQSGRFPNKITFKTIFFLIYRNFGKKISSHHFEQIQRRTKIYVYNSMTPLSIVAYNLAKIDVYKKLAKIMAEKIKTHKVAKWNRFQNNLW